ncbi:hypothetical protein [Dyella sp.]|uniref:hypothetical protein n=1 Tax=Dyella sp. TaxID=1869338 RepID=UPI002FDB0A9F
MLASDLHLAVWLRGIAALSGVHQDATIALGDPSQVGTTQATVLQASRYRGYEVQYAFDLGTRTYTVSDELGRSKLWVNVSKKDWDAIQNGGRSLQVKYLLNNPSISRPLFSGRHGDLSREFTDDCVGLMMSCLLIALWLLIGVRLRRHIVRLACPYQEHQR